MARSSLARRDLRVALLVTAASTALLLLPLPSRLAELARGDLFQIGKDKLAHAALFVVLGWVWSAAAAVRSVRSARAILLGSALLVWGGLIELAQGFSGWRQAEWSDLAADGVGVALALVAFAALRARRTPLEPPELQRQP